jgi:uncharacterized membrane protein YhaH (DUF805 family)
MAAVNPYQRPRAAVADSDEPEYQSVRIFGAAGRIGRVRYIAYTVGLSALIMLVAGLAAALLGRLSLRDGILVALQVGAVGAILLIQVLLTVQRCHDFDVSGWLSILFIVIPLAALLLWIIPGTKGPNRYGLPSE